MSSSVVPPASPSHPPIAAKPRLPFIIALRAVASIIILWHHFALYPPLRGWAAPLAGHVLDWFEVNARATQVFFVIGGYVLARSLSHHRWNLRQVGTFVAQRYCRLGLPYLAVVVLIIPIYLLAGDTLPEAVVGSPASLPQVLAHLFFVQDLLDYEQLSAGLWFVCINFQLGLMYVAMLWLRDVLSSGRDRPGPDIVGWLGWSLSLYSLFHFNLDETMDGWGLYFFPSFFAGIVIHRSLSAGKTKAEFWLYELTLATAMIFEWRWRLASAFIVGLLLFAADHAGWGYRWPRGRVVAWLGKVSYSLFLVHFPVLVLVSTLWVRLEWDSPALALTGLGVSFALSLLSAALFHRWVEQPAAALGRHYRYNKTLQPHAV